ncbi:CoA transferase, partial [Pseudomonas viridiflava]|uniref:CoA transferase n=2 Tax=Pseudomonas TaxID=286 RepID=UPI0013CE6FDA
LDEAISNWSSKHSINFVLDVLEKAEVPAGRIYSVADIVADPHYLARGMILDADLPGGACVKMPGIVPKLSDTPGNVNWQGPSLGQHTQAVLGDLGLTEETIQRLKDGGVVQ